MCVIIGHKTACTRASPSPPGARGLGGRSPHGHRLGLRQAPRSQRQPARVLSLARPRHGAGGRRPRHRPGRPHRPGSGYGGSGKFGVLLFFFYRLSSSSFLPSRFFSFPPSLIVSLLFPPFSPFFSFPPSLTSSSLFFSPTFRQNHPASPFSFPHSSLSTPASRLPLSPSSPITFILLPFSSFTNDVTIMRIHYIWSS